MRHRFAALGILVVAALPAFAFTLDDIRVQATLVDGSAKDPFRIRGRLSGVDARAAVNGFATIRFGDLVAHAPAGGFTKRGNAYTWRSYLFGVKKVTINVKKGTIDIVGGGTELGDLPGPVTLGIGLSKGVTCGRFEWSGAPVTIGLRSGGRGTRKTAAGALAPCTDPPDGLDHQAPTVFINDPTPLSGIATTAPTIAIGGEASDDVGVVGLTWTTDQGAGGSLAPGATWSIAGIGLAPGDTRITVTATDAANNSGSDVLDVTYNTNGIAFEGAPTASPETLLNGRADSVTVRQKIPANPDLDVATIEIVRLEDDGSTPPVAPLADAGDRRLGDDLPGDDVYSGLMGVAGGPDATTPQRFRVTAHSKSQPDLVAWSPVVTIGRIEPIPRGAVEDAIALATNARDLFAGLVTDGVSDDAALAEVLLLARVDGATAAGVSDGGLGAWWMTKDGLLGGMLGYDQTLRRGGAGTPARDPFPSTPGPHSIANTTSGALPSWSEVGSRHTIVLAPYFADAEPTVLDVTLRGKQCPQYEVDTFLGGDAGAEHFKNLEEYGLVLIASHGDNLFSNLGDAYRPQWNWTANGGQSVVLTGTKLGTTNVGKWEQDLRLGRMAIFPDGVAGVLPTFFREYSVRLPQSIVYVGACRSTANGSLASALMERGASAFLGYDGYVDSTFASDMAVEVVGNLLAGQTLAQAFTPGQQDGNTPPATFTFDGDPAMVLATGPIVNRSFEVQTGFLASVAGFTVEGDGRIVGNLGDTVPTNGARMALVSTGLGLTTTSGSFAQTVCVPPLPPGATALKLVYDWNFFSEEFTEYCGSKYQDYFQVSFGETILQSTKVDDLCNDPGTTLQHLDPAKVSFDKGDVWMTDWKTQTIDVTSLAGTTGTLTFAAGDVGDSVFDTVILVDNMRLVAE